METKKKTEQRVIRAALKTNDVTQVKVTFSKEPWTPEEFTSVFMAILETYTEGLLHNNSREAVFTHFNNVFGIFLQKLVPTSKHYELSEAHKAFKEHADETLTKDTEEIKKDNEENRLAAYILSRDILVTEIGLTEEAADLLLNKRLGLLKTPTKIGGEANDKSKKERNKKE